MKFKPVSKRYHFDDSLITDFPAYMQKPISAWAFDVLERVQAPRQLYLSRGSYFLTDSLHQSLQVNLREEFPQQWEEFIHYVLADTDRTLIILQLILNYFARPHEGAELESILSIVSSGWMVIQTNKDASEYTDGVCDLAERVPSATREASMEALSQNEQLLAAWRACYGRKPEYKETVQQSQNVLEELLRDKYLPKDKKAQLGKLIADIKAGKTLSYKGSDVPSAPNVLLELIDKVPTYRGMHTAGTGKNPTRQQAEYILHTTIYLWNLHQR